MYKDNREQGREYNRGKYLRKEAEIVPNSIIREVPWLSAKWTNSKSSWIL